MNLRDIIPHLEFITESRDVPLKANLCFLNIIEPKLSSAKPCHMLNSVI